MMAAVLGCNRNVAQLRRLRGKLNSALRGDTSGVLTPLALNRPHANNLLVLPGQRDRCRHWQFPFCRYYVHRIAGSDNGKAGGNFRWFQLLRRRCSDRVSLALKRIKCVPYFTTQLLVRLGKCFSITLFSATTPGIAHVMQALRLKAPQPIQSRKTDQIPVETCTYIHNLNVPQVAASVPRHLERCMF